MTTLNLNGAWRLIDAEHLKGEALGYAAPETDDTDWMTTAVPGDVHPTLIEAGRLPDPYFGMNVQKCQWTTRREWWFRRTFDAPKAPDGARCELVFDGIDTYATVWLNGHELGRTDNSFLQYRFDVAKHLRPGETNHLVVCVGATTPILEARDTSKYAACFYTPRIFARKAQCQFSWDWSPNLPSLGIWQDVRLEVREHTMIEDVYVRTRTTGDLHWRIALDQPEVERQKEACDDELLVEIQDGRRKVTERVAVCGRGNFLNMKIDDPKLWWPNGYGEPHLYNYTVKLVRGGRAIHTWRGRFGIREVRLIQEPIEKDVQSFRFRVNGVDVFCKGANWVPSDCFPGTVGRERYAHLIRLSREAHFNMLRVWGGGIYEKEEFYDLCDEQGIMIWQDLMFACADIPDDDPEFVVSVIPEFEQQVRRLRRHACLAHWCGGNEKTGTFGAMISYGDRITRAVAPGVVHMMDTDLAYTPSSPNALTDVGQDPQSGDTHGGAYEHAYMDDMRRYRQYVEKIETVFNSEFGMHGPCQMRSLRKFMPTDKMWPLNEVWEEHVQDNPYNEIPETFAQMQEKAAARLFHAPESAAEFVKVAGTLHAEIIRAEFEHHRRRKPVNSGAMLWMLNDTWPCASWSVIDYYGLPKQVYYATKRACAPVMVSVREPDEDTLHVYATSDLTTPLAGTLCVEERSADGATGFTLKRAIKVGRNASKVVARIPRSRLEGLADSFLSVRFEHESANRTETASALHFHNLWHEINWPDPALKMRVGARRKTRDGEYEVKVTLTAGRLARCVNLATAEDVEAYFSDNFFDLAPGERRTVTIRSRRAFRPDRLKLNHWLTTWE